MATVLRIDPGPFEFAEIVSLPARPVPRQQLLAGMEDSEAPPNVRLFSQVTPLDERLQACGAAFISEVERRSADTMCLWHARPVRAPYLAVDLPLDEVRQQRVILRVTDCDSYGLDYAIRGDVMGS
ncbi:MAG: hypothetical protein ACREHD_00245 [Pirellulales bacterium]